jgi:ankyrin repeat protein
MDLQKGCNLKGSSCNEFSPLHLAAFKGDVDLVALLIEHLNTQDLDAPGNYLKNHF